MKDNLGTNTSSKSNLSKDKTCFENIYTKFKVSLFSLLYILLKNQNTNFLIECVYLVLQLLQLLAFPFNQNVIYFIDISLRIFGRGMISSSKFLDSYKIFRLSPCSRTIPRCI